MYPNIPITKPIHPKFIIQHIVASSVRDLYGVQWQPRVVLQRHREVEDSSLKSIDYAVPCFELSQVIDQSPIQIAETLAKHLAGRLTETSDTDYFKAISSESIAGYVNFRLKQSLIKSVIKNSLLWYKTPIQVASGKALDIYLMGYPDDSAEYVGNAVKLAHEVGNLLGVDIAVNYFYQNASSDYIDSLVEQSAADNVGVTEKLKIKRALREHVASSEDVEAAFIDTAGEYTSGQSQSLKHQLAGITGYIVNSEQKLALKVHSFLDNELPTITKGSTEYIFDEANRAIYFDHEHDIVALRSAEGFLYEHAYMLYYLHNLKSWSQNTNRIMLFAPHSKHRLIQTWLSFLYEDSMSVVLFDPTVSKLDIEEFTSVSGGTKQLLTTAQSYLSNFNVIDIDNFNDRYNLLQVADFSIDALVALESRNMPAFFDILSQAAHAIQLES